MTINKTELKALADRVMTDRRFCVDEYHRELAVGVQALLGEIERLERKNANQVESIREYQDLVVDGDRLGCLRADLRVTTGERDELKAERDRLQSQVAALQAEPNSYQSGYDAGQRSHRVTVDRLKAECEGLRKDSARWKWLEGSADPATWESIGCQAEMNRHLHVDAAMAKEQSHD